MSQVMNPAEILLTSRLSKMSRFHSINVQDVHKIFEGFHMFWYGFGMVWQCLGNIVDDLENSKQKNVMSFPGCLRFRRFWDPTLIVSCLWNRVENQSGQSGVVSHICPIVLFGAERQWCCEDEQLHTGRLRSDSETVSNTFCWANLRPTLW